MEIISIFKKYIYLFAIFAFLLIVSYAYFNILLNKKKKKAYAMKGLLLDLSKADILSISLVIVNAVVLMYYLIFKFSLNWALVICSSAFLILSFILQRNLKSFINILINILNIGVIYLNTYIVSLKEILSYGVYIVTQIAVNVFGLLFFLYTLLLFIKSIAIGGDKNENE